MMYRGAYDSAFYRRFRALLHDQVNLQQGEPSERANAALRAGWDALIASERSHRSERPTLPRLMPQNVALPL
jgi:anaerobic magnesium-protoporphyrin IX monomethyl ester cyclase